MATTVPYIFSFLSFLQLENKDILSKLEKPLLPGQGIKLKAQDCSMMCDCFCLRGYAQQSLTSVWI